MKLICLMGHLNHLMKAVLCQDTPEAPGEGSHAGALPRQGLGHSATHEHGRLHLSSAHPHGTFFAPNPLAQLPEYLAPCRPACSQPARAVQPADAASAHISQASFHPNPTHMCAADLS